MFKKLITWSSDNYSHLPWRQERSLYRTLVSEIMLQQTTVGTVQNHFEKFITLYPDIKSLANATEDEVVIAWKGLGYYRRAKNLRHIAIEIEKKFKSKIPTKLEELLLLKGVGDYTANALIAIGSDLPGLCLDANLERVLARFYGYEEIKGPKLLKKIRTDFAAGKILNEMKEHSPREFNEALMDLGRSICQKNKSWCHVCPLQKKCVASKSRDPLSYPREDAQKEKKYYELELLRVVVQKNNKILFFLKNEKEWLAGQWELPTFIIKSEDQKLTQYPYLDFKLPLHSLGIIKSSITKYKIKNYILEISESEFKKINKNNRFVFKTYDSKLNTGSVMMKILKKISI